MDGDIVTFEYTHIIVYALFLIADIAILSIDKTTCDSNLRAWLITNITLWSISILTRFAHIKDTGLFVLNIARSYIGYVMLAIGCVLLASSSNCETEAPVLYILMITHIFMQTICIIAYSIFLCMADTYNCDFDEDQQLNHNSNIV